MAERRVLAGYLNNIPYDKSKNLVECWLLSLLDLNRDKVDAVLHERDKIIEQKQYEAEEKDITQDKGLYLLSEIAINLKELLGFEISND